MEVSAQSPMPVEIRTTASGMDIEHYKEFIGKHIVTYPSEECTICLEPLVVQSSSSSKTAATCRLGCGHSYHHDCLVKCCTTTTTTTTTTTADHSSCPFCRASLDLSFPECGYCEKQLDPFEPTTTMSCCGSMLHTHPCVNFSRRMARERPPPPPPSSSRRPECNVCCLRGIVSSSHNRPSSRHSSFAANRSQMIHEVIQGWIRQQRHPTMQQLHPLMRSCPFFNRGLLRNYFEARVREERRRRRMDIGQYKEFIDKLTVVTHPSDKCTFCKEALESSSSKAAICRLGCGHSFHHNCIVRSQNDDCPICNANIKLTFPQCGHCEERLHPFRPISTMSCCGLTMHTLCLKSWLDNPSRGMGCNECRRVMPPPTTRSQDADETCPLWIGVVRPVPGRRLTSRQMGSFEVCNFPIRFRNS